jgi:hypothetical protein
MDVMVLRSAEPRRAPRQPWWAWAVAGVAVLALASGSAAQPVGSLDGWGTDGGPGNPTLSAQSAFGVTTGTFALKSVNPQGSFWGPSTGNLIARGNLADLRGANRIAFDLTMIGSEINGGSGNFNGFAQANELAVSLFSNAVPTLPSGINLFLQRNFASGNATDSRSLGAQWSGQDGVRTISFDLTMFSGTDPTDGVTKTVAQLLTAHPDIQDAKISFVEQFGGGTTTVGPGAFYFDNVRLTGTGVNATIGNFEAIPEPASLALTALAVPPLMWIARRRRRAAAQSLDGSNSPTGVSG